MEKQNRDIIKLKTIMRRTKYHEKTKHGYYKVKNYNEKNKIKSFFIKIILFN